MSNSYKIGTIFSIITISCITAIIYSNVLFGPFVFDDMFFIAKNDKVKSLSNFLEIPGSRYILYLTFALNYFFNGLDTFGYHFVNIIIHIINSILVYSFLRLTMEVGKVEQFKSSSQKVLFFIPLAAFILFAFHPIHTQAVSYIYLRSASLTTLFFLFALILYIKARLCLSSGFTSRNDIFKLKHLTYYISSLVFIGLAMRTKEISFTLPFIIFLYEFTFFSSLRDISKFQLFYLIPFVLTIFIIPMGKIDVFIKNNENVGDLLPAVSTLPRHEYLFTQFRIIVTYLRLLFFPVNQNLDYDYPIYNSIFQTDVLFSFFLLLTIFSVAIYFFLQRSRSFFKKVSAFGILWFFITISIESSIVPLMEIFFEHRIYLPSVGIIMAGASFICYIFLHLKNKTYVFFVIIAFLLSASTYKRNQVWSDEQLLWEDAISKSPNKPRPYGGLGGVFEEQGKLKKAIELYSKAITVDGDFAFAYYLLGDLYYLKKNDYQLAVENYTRAIEVKPDYANAFYQRASAYLKLGDFTQSVNDYTNVLKHNPDHVSSYVNRGMSYFKSGKLKEAIVDYSKAIELDNKTVEAYSNRGIAYYSLGKPQLAITDFNNAIGYDPKNFNLYHSRGIVYLNLGKSKEALKDFKRAIEINSDFVEVYLTRSDLYLALGKTGNALGDINKAIELDPENDLTYFKRGIIFRRLKNYTESIKSYNKAIEINPKYADAYNNRGNLYLALGNYEKSINDLSKAVNINPKYGNAYNNRGNAFLFLKKFERAISDYTKAIDYLGSNAIIYYNRGNSYFNLKRFSQAIKEFKKAIEINPNFAYAYYLSGLSYMKLSENEKSIKYFQKASDMGIKEARDWL